MESRADCVFCKIAAGEIPSTIVFQDDELIAFRDTAPQAPVHVLVIPKTHIPGIFDLDDSALAGRLLVKAQEIARQEGCGEGGARFVINCGKDGGQAVGHLHIHVLGGRALGWPPG